jgi:protein-S-isoprenylcysteine O-methyltransferase Ste14
LIPIAPRSDAVILLRALLFISAVSSVVIVGLPWMLLAAFPASPLSLGCARWAAGPLAAAALLVYLVCLLDFLTVGRGTPAFYDPPRSLVLRGLYRRVRNPMYLSVLALVLSEALYFDSAVLLAYSAGAAVFIHLFVVLYEEPNLVRRFGPSYLAYRQAVPRWIPRLGRLPDSSTPTASGP